MVYSIKNLNFIPIFTFLFVSFGFRIHYVTKSHRVSTLHSLHSRNKGLSYGLLKINFKKKRVNIVYTSSVYTSIAGLRTRTSPPLPKMTPVPLMTFDGQSFFYGTLTVHLLPYWFFLNQT